MKKKVVLLLCAITVLAASLYGCGTTNTSSSSSAVSEVAPVESEVSSSTSSEETKATFNDNIKLTDTTYESEHIKLVYPVVSQMDDPAVEETVNKLILEQKNTVLKQYAQTANLDGVVEVTFLDGQTLSLIYKWTLTNPDQNIGFSKTYEHTLVVNLRTGEKKYLHQYASPYKLNYQLKYNGYQVVTDQTDDVQSIQLYVNSLVRNKTLSKKRLMVADYPLSASLNTNLYGYVTEGKIGLIVNSGVGESGAIRLEFNRKDVMV